MSEKVMLVLIGGRSAVPTVAGVLQFLDEVDKIKFILCKGGQYLQYQKNVETVIKQNRQDLIFNNETDVIKICFRTKLSLTRPSWQILVLKDVLLLAVLCEQGQLRQRQLRLRPLTLHHQL
ncbi:MAG: hypothetical protein ACKPB7_21700 [Sphaerospermopsis kisseleviana]